MAEELTQADIDKAKAEVAALADSAKKLGLKLVDAQGKPLYKSKIFWANAVALGITAAGALGANLSVADFAVVEGVVIPLLNIVLRYLNPDISGVMS
jgi:hypothetical protein